MLSEFFASCLRFQHTADKFRREFDKLDEPHFIAKFRIEATASDVLGAAAAAFDAYQKYSPWFFEELIEVGNIKSPDIPMSKFDAYMKFVENRNSVSSCDKEYFDDQLAKSFASLTRAIELQKVNRMSGFDARKEMDKQRLISTFKSFLFFLRSFQDVSYNSIMTLKTGISKPTASMSATIKDGALRSGNPVAEIVRHVDGYFEWFQKIRDLRNDFKFGASSAPCGSVQNFGIGIAKMSADGAMTVNVQRNLLFGGITESLNMCSLLLESQIIEEDTAL